MAKKLSDILSYLLTHVPAEVCEKELPEKLLQAISCLQWRGVALDYKAEDICEFSKELQQMVQLKTVTVKLSSINKNLICSFFLTERGKINHNWLKQLQETVAEGLQISGSKVEVTSLAYHLLFQQGLVFKIENGKCLISSSKQKEIVIDIQLVYLIKIQAKDGILIVAVEKTSSSDEEFLFRDGKLLEKTTVY